MKGRTKSESCEGGDITLSARQSHSFPVTSFQRWINLYLLRTSLGKSGCSLTHISAWCLLPLLISHNFVTEVLSLLKHAQIY